MDPLSRTTSTDSSRSHTSGHILHVSVASSSTSSSRKAKHADLETTPGEVDGASISMPPPSSKSNARYRNVVGQAPRISENVMMAASNLRRDDFVTPTQEDINMAEGDERAASADAVRVTTPQSPGGVPEPSVSGASNATRRSDPGLESNRVSFSSLFNLGRSNWTPGPSSVGGGSDQDGKAKLDFLKGIFELTERQQNWKGAIGRQLLRIACL